MAAGWNPEYQGRADHQVKVRGMRVELAEVQAVLLEQEAVGDGVVDTRTGADGSPLIVAYVTPKDATAPPTTEALRAHLKAKLPEYMVPSAWVVMDSLPRTPGGKVDRKALPAPDVMAAAAEYVAPRNAQEEVLCGLFADVLGVPRVGIHDNFFDLGGHSLLIMGLVNRIRSTLGVELSVRTVFESPTVARLGSQARGTPREVARIARIARRGDPPLSYAQERLWFLDRLEQGSAAYNIPSARRLLGDVNEGALAPRVRYAGGEARVTADDVRERGRSSGAADPRAATRGDTCGGRGELGRGGRPEARTGGGGDALRPAARPAPAYLVAP